MSIYFDNYPSYVRGTAPEKFCFCSMRPVHHTWTPVPWRCSIWALIVCMLLMIFFWWPTSVIPKLITSLEDRTMHQSMHWTTVRGKTSEIYGLSFFIIESKGSTKGNTAILFMNLYKTFQHQFQGWWSKKKYDLKFCSVPWQACLKVYLNPWAVYGDVETDVDIWRSMEGLSSNSRASHSLGSRSHSAALIG